jgi:hypothetical protein
VFILKLVGESTCFIGGNTRVKCETFQGLAIGP